MIMLNRAALIAAALATVASLWGAASAQDPPSATSRYVWDLSASYPTQADWDADRAFVLEGMRALDQSKGQAGRSAASLADLLDRLRAVRARAGRMARFAVLTSEIDQESSLARSRVDAATALETRVEAVAGPLEAEIKAVGQARLRRWQAEEPALAPHRRRLLRIMAEAPHAFPPHLASVGASLERWPRSLADAAGAISGSDVGWASVRGAQADDIKVDAGVFFRLRRSAEKDLRDRASKAYFARHRALQEPYGLLLGRRVEADLAIARLRGFDNHLDAFYQLRDGIPAGGYHRAVETPRIDPATPKRLAAVFGRIHRLNSISLADLMARPYEFGRAVPVAEAIETIVSASAPMGADYQADLRTRLAQPWMHLPPQAGKSGTVGVFWQVGGGHPYTLLTYRDDLNSSRAFANAATLMMTYADIPPEAFPDRREEDPPIHGNVIWYVGGLLHDDYLLTRLTDRNDRLALLVEHIQTQVRLAYQYAALAELEEQILGAIEAGRPLTGEEISQAYLTILRRNLGHGQGGVTVEDAFAAQWMTDASAFFFGPFPAVFLSAGAGAALLTEKLQAEDSAAVAAMRNAMGRGDADYSHELLLKAGVDLRTDAPYAALIRRINRKLDQLEQELGRP